MTDTMQLNSDPLPAVFTVYKPGEVPRKIHAVDWAAHQINGWQREPLTVVADADEHEETQAESLAQKTRQKRTQT